MSPQNHEKYWFWPPNTGLFTIKTSKHVYRFGGAHGIRPEILIFYLPNETETGTVDHHIADLKVKPLRCEHHRNTWTSHRMRKKRRSTELFLHRRPFRVSFFRMEFWMQTALRGGSDIHHCGTWAKSESPHHPRRSRSSARAWNCPSWKWISWSHSWHLPTFWDFLWPKRLRTPAWNKSPVLGEISKENGWLFSERNATFHQMTYMDVSLKWWYPQIIHFNRVFHL